MEEKRTDRLEQPAEQGGNDGGMTRLLGELQSMPGGIADKMKTVFTQWDAEGLAPADMFRRVSELFDFDPAGAEKAFGGDYLDIVDYFTHYWV